ncbi:hypothetical protein K435DRAFT_586449, partial [Dendrothele bispora CBS 962.96]
MKAFIKCLLGYDPSDRNKEAGILGHVKAYYGCVEAQGRGSLHCHMVVWLEGGLNPNEIREKIMSRQDDNFTDRLVEYLDDTISTEIPSSSLSSTVADSNGVHPCRIGPVLRTPFERDESYRQRLCSDLMKLVRKTQVHTHSSTCYKYWKNGKSPRSCRFELDESNTQATTTVDYEKGEINLRHVDGLINPYNPTLLSALRCNMDIKFIGSGTSAKAILYYITDYITKTQLKTHVAFGALDAAVQSLGSYKPDQVSLSDRGKQLLNRCAYKMLSHQELSAQQVALSLLGNDDFYSSHRFKPLHWTQFEKFVDDQFHSPECY